MIVGILAVLYVLGLGIFFFKRELAVYYYLCWNMFAPYVTSFLLFDKVAVTFVNGQSNYFLLLVFLINTVRIGRISPTGKILKVACIIGVLLMIAALFNSVAPLNYIKWFVSNILPIYLIYSLLSSIEIDRKVFLRFLIIIILLQLFIGYCQYFTSILFVSPILVMNEYGIGEFNQFMGTFQSCNGMGAMMSLYFMSIMILIDFDNFWSKFFFLLLSAAFFYGILLSGIRTYLLLNIAFFFVLFYIKSIHKIIAISFIVGVALWASSYLIITSYVSNYQGDDPIERQINGLSSLKAGDTDESTLGYTTYMLTTYFNPFDLFGKGKLYTKQGYGKIILREYGYPDADVSDAMLSVYLVEFGLILLFLFLYYYYTVVTSSFSKNQHKGKLYITILFAYYLIATITDDGIFNSEVLTIMLMLSAVLCQFDYQRNSKQNSNETLTYNNAHGR